MQQRRRGKLLPWKRTRRIARPKSRPPSGISDSARFQNNGLVIDIDIISIRFNLFSIVCLSSFSIVPFAPYTLCVSFLIFAQKPTSVYGDIMCFAIPSAVKPGPGIKRCVKRTIHISPPFLFGKSCGYFIFAIFMPHCGGTTDYSPPDLIPFFSQSDEIKKASTSFVSLIIVYTN